MSLHRKIVAWFAVFAVMAVMVFGIGDYVQSTRALRFALETRASSLAQQIASDVERRYELAMAELVNIGYAVAAGAPAGSAAVRGQYADLRVMRRDTIVYAVERFGPEPPLTLECVEGDITYDAAFVDEAGVPHRVQARMSLGQFVAGVPSAGVRLGKRGFTMIARTDDGSVLFDDACSAGRGGHGSELLPAISAQVMASAGAAPRTAVFSELVQARGEDRALTVVRMAEPAWSAVVSLDHAEFAAPFESLRRQYFGAMVAVMAVAFLIVLVGIRRDMRRLAAISRAADAIGHGRFDVWLPPPTGDELGRVSLALGRMVDRLSSSLRQVEVSRSMAAVGELSTFLSHEIRNPLSSMRLNLQMLKRDLRGGAVPDDGEQLVGLCLTELQRLDDVVKTVLDMGRTGVQARGECVADDVLVETLRVMERKVAARGVTIATAFRAPGVRVAMASAALRSIVMNLVLNSIDALADTPQPRVRIGTGLQDEGGAEPWLELRVADNGPGVPAHLRSRIFDPFFTTKPSGNGIGLPTALRAVQECGGILRYAPASEGGGAEFVLELPLAGSVGGFVPLDETPVGSTYTDGRFTPVPAGG